MPPIRPLTILVVDDDISLSLFFKETLMKEGHRVFVTVNEHGALETLKNEAVDILLCDFVLPGLDGGKIVAIAKEMRPTLFCVLISGHHQKLVSEKISGTSADMIIAKPILKQTLHSIIQKFRETAPLF
ncbi:MAG: response regulator [Ignavibacteriales bacterium]|nr:response regulator [Ignavibacteriales bacterium]